MSITKNNKINGFSLIEVILSMGFFSLIVFAVLQLFIVSNESHLLGETKEHAQNLIQEYFEDIKNLRANRWNDLLNGNYSLIKNSLNNLQLIATTSGEKVGNYTRFVEISNAQRDDSGKIVITGGTPDPSTKKIAVTVSWTGYYSGTLSQFQFIARYPHNAVWSQTLDTEFSQPPSKLTNVIVTKQFDGEITLGAGGHGDWCKPTFDTELDLPRQGVANAVTAITGQAFAGTGANASGESFTNIKIDDAIPPHATISGSFNGYKTNDIFGEPTFGYIATDTNNKEIVIINIASTPYTEIGYFDADGVIDANSVRVANDTGYMVQGNIFRLFSLKSASGQPDRTGSRPELGNITLLGTGNKFAIVGDYAYIPISGSQYEMQIVNIKDPTNLKTEGKIDIDKNRTEVNQTGVDVTVNSTGTRAYLITANYPNRADFFIIDITDKANPSIVQILKNGILQNAEYNTNAMDPRGVEVVPGNVAIVVGIGGEEYQVLRISGDNPAYCSGVNVDSGIYDSSSVLDTNTDTAYTYVVTGDASKELKIIEGGPGKYYASGIFESQTYDAGDFVAFNRFFVTADTPIGTNIEYKAAVVNPPPGGTCLDANFSELNFMGGNGTNSYLEANSALPLNNDGTGYENPGRCLRLRAYLSTTDPTSIPTLFDFRVNYSP